MPNTDPYGLARIVEAIRQRQQQIPMASLLAPLMGGGMQFGFEEPRALTPEQSAMGVVEPAAVQPADLLGVLAAHAISPQGRAILGSERGAIGGGKMNLADRAKLIAEEIEKTPEVAGQWEVRKLGKEPSTKPAGPRTEDFYRWESGQGKTKPIHSEEQRLELDSPATREANLDSYEQALKDAITFNQRILDRHAITQSEPAQSVEMAQRAARSNRYELARLQQWRRQQLDRAQVEKVFGAEATRRIYSKDVPAARTVMPEIDPGEPIKPPNLSQESWDRALAAEQRERAEGAYRRIAQAEVGEPTVIDITPQRPKTQLSSSTTPSESTYPGEIVYRNLEKVHELLRPYISADTPTSVRTIASKLDALEGGEDEILSNVGQTLRTLKGHVPDTVLNDVRTFLRDAERAGRYTHRLSGWVRHGRPARTKKLPPKKD